MDFILRRMFGASSEKLRPEQLELMLSLQEEAQGPGKDGASVLEGEAAPPKPRPERESRERVPSHLPVVDEILQHEEVAAPGLLASIAVDIYCDHLPLCCQESILRTRHGITLPHSTLARWMQLVAFWLNPVYRHLRDKVLQRGYIEVDERSCDHRLPEAARQGAEAGASIDD